MRGLFLNTKKAQCSIYESGLMVYNCLKASERFSLAYQEIDKDSRAIDSAYDFYIFNYHYVTMGWLDTSKLRKELTGYIFAIVLEMLPNDPFVKISKTDFDGYIVLDPTCPDIYNNVFPFPRPLDIVDNILPYNENMDVPIIGSFGFATTGKGYEKVIDAVCKEFDNAEIRINIPRGDYVPQNDFDAIVNSIKNHPVKTGIKLNLTHNYFSKPELVSWCSQNTLNVFLYDRDMPGLSATTDQAILGSRPLSVSTNETFRHIHKYLKPYPFQTLHDSIFNSSKVISKILEDWSPVSFLRKFEETLSGINVKPAAKNAGKQIMLSSISPTRRLFVCLPSSLSLADFIPPIVFKAHRKIRRHWKPTETGQRCEIRTLLPGVSHLLRTYSQFNEDLIIDLLLGIKNEGFYVDVGANNPVYNSNTKLFYDRGWTGINIDPNPSSYMKFSKHRKKDINLNLAISNSPDTELAFYTVGDDSTVSTVDYFTAKKMSLLLNLPLMVSRTKSKKLYHIFGQYLQNRNIDFMSIDCEGHDLEALKSNDWEKYRAAIVIVETNNNHEQIVHFMRQNEYLLIFNNYYNSLFIDKFTKDENILRYLKI